MLLETKGIATREQEAFRSKRPLLEDPFPTPGASECRIATEAAFLTAFQDG